MGFLELFLIGVGLSMDAFAVAICQGLSMTRIKWGHALTVGLYFGGFQALMPLLGWVLGSQFSGYIQQYDHWVAFILLLLIGGNMIREALSASSSSPERASRIMLPPISGSKIKATQWSYCWIYPENCEPSTHPSRGINA